MGSFGWDRPSRIQYHNGQPLSVALTEPCNCQSKSSRHVQDEYALQQFRPRSQSCGRKIQRESYRIYNPNIQYATFCYSLPFSHRMMDHSTAGDMFVEKYITIEEDQCRPHRCCSSYAREHSPPVRQVKIRSRPSSCVDLHQKVATENQVTKIVDERCEEHYDWHYNITLPIQRTSSSTTFGKSAVETRMHDDRHVPITPRIARAFTRDVGTITDVLPKKLIKPLSISETQVLDRYEKEEKIRRDSMTTDTGNFSYTVCQQPLCRSFDGTALRTFNSMNSYSDWGNDRMIVRPTAKPREALVDAPAIVAPPTKSELSRPITYETTYRTRNYFQPI